MIKKMLQFIREAREELNKVTWPSKDDVTKFTIVVLITVIIISIFLWMVDRALMLLIEMVIK
jgi:preprotein translocase subunit SecE